MTARRVALGFGFLLVAHNFLRVIGNLMGAGPGIFNYLSPSSSPTPMRNGAPGSSGLVFFAAFILCVMLWAVWYDRRKPQDERSRSLWSSALWAAFTSVLFGLLVVWVSTTVERTYGWALFVFLPVLMGIEATLLMARVRDITLADALAVSALAAFMLGVALLVFAVEGIICLIMAIPIAVPLAMLGGFFGYVIQRRPAARSSLTCLLIAGLTPFGATIERAIQPPADFFTVATTIDLPVPPERVWQTVLQPARLSAPSHPLFRAGVAYPLASHIEGTGLAATRYCDFSTGKLVEPVLIWRDLRQLRFTVVANPLPMQEWTPYSQIHPPHLDGFLVSRQGEFRLSPLPNGGTRLTATTWYQHHLWPARYWRAWSDYIIHQVHGMVLENIRQRAVGS